MTRAKKRSSRQLELLSTEDIQPTIEVLSFSGLSALEDENFPFELISEIAERESWRKEINRPIYHIHKWWAQRLGSVFRAITIGALSPSGTNVFEAFYQPLRLPKAVVFDPFMGSGTTVGEAVKLGARAIGRDINPVAHFLVRNALALHDRKEILTEFNRIAADVSETIQSFYKTELPDGREATVLYWFWVKTVSCPDCSEEVDLFGSRIFARHAYAKKHPECRATCPVCGGINVVRYDDTVTTCEHCLSNFNPQQGNAKGQKATCPSCDCQFQISKTIRESNQPPKHRLYAKLVLMSDGTKEYHEVTEADRSLYESATDLLKERSKPFPIVSIEPGQNTNQALGYNYRAWHEMFNDRQLLCLSILAERIKKIEDQSVRELFTCLFSGALEFNNMFASYKGEGTGAVRHMFAHHVLKPERVPLEANLWGTPKSSGSFMTMFQGRIMRALEYAEAPFELKIDEVKGKKATLKVYGLSEPIGFDIATSFAEFQNGKRLYLSCGDSSCTDIETGSVNAVITDPPFFDNVHYSQLADFFHVWQRHILGTGDFRKNATTRSEREVQNSSVTDFTDRLQGVWTEAARVLKDDGILVFTYHHSRSEGWSSVLQALSEAGLVVTASQPIKAEMSVAMPKQQTKEPIDLDIVVVCRKRGYIQPTDHEEIPWKDVERLARNQIDRFGRTGRQLSRNDVRVIIMGQLLKSLSSHSSFDMSYNMLINADRDIENLIEKLHVKKSKTRLE
jgi:adenine-specific DNA methylase